MPLYAVLLIVGWLTWLVPFFLMRRNGSAPQRLDTRARWGMLLEVVAYTILWQNPFWLRHPQPWRLGSGAVFLMLASVLSWTSPRRLGRQWRVDAGLNADHQLVTSGAYAVVRHPIYTSMLCLCVGTGLVITPIPVLLLALVIFMVGTEIRVRIEDGLLASRFGDEFRVYQRKVPAYLPFLRGR